MCTCAHVSGLVATVWSVKIHAAARPADDTTAEPHRWTVECDDYDAGYAEAQAAVPDGWKLIHVQVDRG